MKHETGLRGYLWVHELSLKDFGKHAERTSQQVKEASLAVMAQAGRPVRYLNSGKIDKQALAPEIAQADGLRSGPICALTANGVVPQLVLRGNRAERTLQLERSGRKCLFVYQYWMHPVFGFMSAGLQTWFPFTAHIYLNGRLWLAQQLDQAGIANRRHRNCFTWIEDLARAQQLMDAQLQSP